MKKFCQIALIVIAISPVAGCGELFGSLISLDVLQWGATIGEIPDVYQEGTTVSLSHITGGAVADPFIPDCACQHLHAVDPAGIMILNLLGEDFVGPFPDPNPRRCGYGCIGTSSDFEAFTPNRP